MYITLSEYLKEQNEYLISKFFSNINLKTEDVFDMIDYHDAYINLYPNFDEFDNDYGDDYYFSSKETAYKEVNDILNMFNSMPNPIPIYRTIKVDDISNIRFDFLGDSWSFEKQSAIDFANNEVGGNILLCAKTNFDNVNWESTLDLYFRFSNNFDGSDENELAIIDSDLDSGKILDLEIEEI